VRHCRCTAIDGRIDEEEVTNVSKKHQDGMSPLVQPALVQPCRNSHLADMSPANPRPRGQRRGRGARVDNRRSRGHWTRSPPRLASPSTPQAIIIGRSLSQEASVGVGREAPKSMAREKQNEGERKRNEMRVLLWI
jgi:hypothetical protein